MSVHALRSPDGRVALRVVLDGGTLLWETSRDGVVTSALSPLGMVTEAGDLSRDLMLEAEQRGEIDEPYVIPAFKKAICPNRARTLSLALARGSQQLIVEARAYDDGAAVRLVVPGKGMARIDAERTAFTVPDGAGELHAQRLLFTYEDHYLPVPRSELPQNPFAFPILVDAGHGQWALYTEANVHGDYGGSHVLATPEQPSRLTLQRATDQLDPIRTPYPVATPWRVVLMGDLDAIVNSNTIENLNPPSILEDTSWIRPGLAAWSWMTENASTRDTERIYQYVDYAAAMGWPYYLADGGWPGYVDIPALVQYAAERGVRIWLWEHSMDMADPQEAEEKMRLWKSWGVVGLKIDFFESDRPERMARYDMLAELAARHRLMLNFHGATKPAGEIRTWPHVLTREGVMGGEYLQNFSTYLPGGPDAAHHCTLPFTRNAVGPMDFTPVVYRTYETGTTDCHQTALAVIFTSYIQHIGEGAEKVLENPCRPFLSILPAAWDEGVLLEGYPASHVTMARRKGDQWFVGGICAGRPRNARVDLSFLAEGSYEAMFCDDLNYLRPFDAAVGALPPADQALVDLLDASRQRPTGHQHDVHRVRIESRTVTRDETLTIPLSYNGGFALHLKRATA